MDQVTEVFKIRQEILGTVPKEWVELKREMIDIVYELEGRFVMILLLERIGLLQQLES